MRNRDLRQKAYAELKRLTLIVFYLWVFLAVLEVHKSIILAENNINIHEQSFAINALALGKVMLVARDFHVGDLRGNPPLIYPTLLKSTIFCLLLICFKILEETAVGMYRGLSFTQSIADLAGGTLKGILSLAAIAFVLLIPFFAFAELGEALGEGRLARMFFVQGGRSGLPNNHSSGGGRIPGVATP